MESGITKPAEGKQNIRWPVPGFSRLFPKKFPISQLFLSYFPFISHFSLISQLFLISQHI